MIIVNYYMHYQDMIYLLNFDYVNDSHVKFNLSNLDNILNYKEVFEKNNINFELCLSMMIIHWFGLAQYYKNNIIKSISSLMIASYLYKKYLVN